jgi:putative ubiquitin-RnfH superfamily antitoxin RatB of RatAB toxin-antitoxin module
LVRRKKIQEKEETVSEHNLQNLFPNMEKIFSNKGEKRRKKLTNSSRVIIIEPVISDTKSAKQESWKGIL